MTSVFNSGEQKLQQLTGEARMASMNGRIIKEKIVGGAINFIEKQALAFVASTDPEGQNWASLLLGDFGFIQVPNNQLVIFDLNKIRSPKEDVFFTNILSNPQVGLLFIEMASRIRYRVNGKASIKGQFLEIQIQEAYPNCPKYIQRRDFKEEQAFLETPAQIEKGKALGSPQLEWIQKADTFFVASSGADGRADASHRGGKAGFVEIVSEDSLRIPDYPGNSMFNTLGNIYENRATGLLFIDFKLGKVLQLTGKATIQLEQNSEADLQQTGQTGRFWLFHIDQWIMTQKHHQLEWDFIDYSPFNP